MTDQIFQLVYISTAREGLTGSDCQAILSAARLKNRRHDVTGLLLFNSKRFLQVLEGAETAVRAIYEGILHDPRHQALVKLGERNRDSREFGTWAMAFDDPAAPDANLAAKVDALLSKADPSTAALFRSTAQLHRRA